MASFNCRNILNLHPYIVRRCSQRKKAADGIVGGKHGIVCTHKGTASPAFQHGNYPELIGSYPDNFIQRIINPVSKKFLRQHRYPSTHTFLPLCISRVLKSRPYMISYPFSAK